MLKNMQKDGGEQYLAKQKHQLKALEVAGEDERQEMLQEMKKAVVFYDAAVHTGNEVLDTILTEKSVLCVNRNIRLSCMADTNRLGHMRVIDLYTMLVNAIDNAIECVDRFADDEKKVISLLVREQGGMLYISVENYFEGELVLRNGYPVTSKKDQANHGFGVKSIRMIAKRYGWRYPGEHAEPYFFASDYHSGCGGWKGVCRHSRPGLSFLACEKYVKLADFLLTDVRTHTIIGKSANADILLCVNAGHSPDAHFIWLYLCRAEMLCRIDRVEKGSVRTYESLIRSTKLIGETRRRDHEDIYG